MKNDYKYNFIIINYLKLLKMIMNKMSLFIIIMLPWNYKYNFMAALTDHLSTIMRWKCASINRGKNVNVLLFVIFPPPLLRCLPFIFPSLDPYVSPTLHIQIFLISKRKSVFPLLACDWTGWQTGDPRWIQLLILCSRSFYIIHSLAV